MRVFHSHESVARFHQKIIPNQTERSHRKDTKVINFSVFKVHFFQQCCVPGEKQQGLKQHTQQASGKVWKLVYLSFKIHQLCCDRQKRRPCLCPQSQNADIYKKHKSTVNLCMDKHEIMNNLATEERVFFCCTHVHADLSKSPCGFVRAALHGN